MQLAVNTFFKLQLKRHINNPALWLMVLIAPVASRFMVPLQSDSYSVLTVNNAYPELTPSVIGLKLGIISALLLTPLVYIFLRTARTASSPWQVEDVTPSRRISLHVGHWLADTLVVWLFIFGLAVSGVVLSYFRLPFEQINGFQTMVSCMVIACPAFAFIAAIRIFFSSRPMLRGATGDFVFFLIWMAGIVAGAIASQSQSNAFMDLYGYASPIALASDDVIESLAVGASPLRSNVSYIALDAWRGVTYLDFLVSRIFWLVVAACIVLLSSLLYAQRKPKIIKQRWMFKRFKTLSSTMRDIQQSLLANTLAFAPLLTSNTMQIFRTSWLLPLLLTVAIAGWSMPFRGVIGPLIWLLVIFPFSQHAARWQRGNLPSVISTLPTSWLKNQGTLLLAFSLPLFVFVLPSTLQMLISGDLVMIGDVVFIVIGVPLATLVLSNISKSSFAIRLPMLIAWYVYFNMK